MYFSFLNNPIISGILGGIISIILFNIDSKITKIKKEKKEYIKIFIVTTLIVGTIIYLLNIDNINSETINLGTIKKNISSETIYNSSEPCLPDTGLPSF